MGVDHSTIALAPGRSSVRVASTATYNHGLIILDLEHMPGGICGTWPAFWLLGPNWPDSGEVDIIENVNSASTNQMTLHTNAGCSITNNGLSSGTILGTNCDVDASGNAGCSMATSNTESYGNGFNTANGGVYATEWTSNGIGIWFFPRSSIPSDIAAGTPNPSNWGLPLAEFSGGCDIDEHFVNQQIVFDTTFCGDWAGGVWSTDPVCSQKASTCVDYVMNNPADFTDAYWSINSLKVYQDNGAAASSSAVGTATSTSVVATATVTATYSLGSATSTFVTTFATSTSSYSSSVGTSSSAATSSSYSNTFFTSTPTSFSNTFFTSTPTSYSNTFTLSSTYTNTFFTSTSTSYSNTFFPPSSTFSNTFFTSTPTSYSNTFSSPSSTWTNTDSWSKSWTAPTGTSSWSSWGGGPGGNGGGHWVA